MVTTQPVLIPDGGLNQPVSGAAQPPGKLSVSASMTLTVAFVVTPPGTPIDTPPVGAPNVTVKAFGPSSTLS